MSTLSYLGNVNIAVARAREKFPDASLFEVDGRTADGSSTVDPKEITQLRLVFDNDQKATVFIESKKTWGEWGDPEIVYHRWVGDVIVPWPVEFELVDAYKVVVQHFGSSVPFKTVTLRWPLNFPLPKEPSYIFQLDNANYIFVGVYSHKIQE